MNVHQKPRAGILLEVDLSVRPESYYYYYYSLIFTRSRLRDSATATLRPGMAQQLSKWSHRHNLSAYSPKWKKAPRCIGRTITGQKHSPAALLQPSTITCCDRSDRNSVNIDNTDPPIHRTELMLRQKSLMIDPITSCAKINLYDPSLLPTL